MLVAARAVELYSTCLINATTRQCPCEYGHLRVLIARSLCSCSVFWTACTACALNSVCSFHVVQQTQTRVFRLYLAGPSVLYSEHLSRLLVLVPCIRLALAKCQHLENRSPSYMQQKNARSAGNTKLAFMHRAGCKLQQLRLLVRAAVSAQRKAGCAGPRCEKC